jgi:endonuclease/exonuclease/phosphatase family metal-dependent hydrolase
VTWKPGRIDGAAIVAFVLVVVGAGVYLQQSGRLTAADSAPTSAATSSTTSALPTVTAEPVTPSVAARSRSTAPSGPTHHPARSSPSRRPGKVHTSQPPPGGAGLSASDVESLVHSVKGLEGLLGAPLTVPQRPSPALPPAQPPAQPPGQPPAQPPVQPTTFRVGSFNVLGAIHTGPGGNKPRYASGSVRAAWAMQIVRAAGLDVVGLQEFEAPQFQTFQRVAGGAFDAFPGLSHGHKPVQNSIAWRQDVWALQEAHLIGIPYFHGHIMPMPYVRLESRQTGQDVWFMNVHNPANTHGPAGRYRARAISLESTLVRRLHADGTPVVFTGDFNDRLPAFCPLTSRAPLHAANGGVSSGGCHLPADAGIDWIFATPEVRMSNYVRQRSGLVLRTTDHPFVHATATVSGATP